MPIDEAYVAFKGSLAGRGCKIISEDPPRHLIVKQGSLWGIDPKTAKKTVDVTFTPVDSGTQVTCSSRLSRDWRNLTIVGCALAVVLVGLCLWMALDISAFITSDRANFWSWIATVNGNVDVSAAQDFVNLTKALAVFLSLVTALEIAVAVYAYKRLDSFAREAFGELSNREPPVNAPKQ